MTQQLAQRIRLRETIGESNYATTRFAYELDACKDRRRVGKLRVRGNDFLDWDYRFREPR